MRNTAALAVAGLAVAALAVAGPAVAGPASAKTYEIDADHSGVTFSIKHLGSRVSGRFDKFSGAFEHEPGKPEGWKVAAEIETGSINTNNPKRDKHLLSADFFDAERCPKIAFKSEKVEIKEGSDALLHGMLSMHCVTKPVVLKLELGSEMADPWGNMKLGAHAEGTVKRSDFDITWNKALDSEKTRFLLGDEVKIAVDIEGAPKAAK